MEISLNSKRSIFQSERKYKNILHTYMFGLNGAMEVDYRYHRALLEPKNAQENQSKYQLSTCKVDTNKMAALCSDWDGKHSWMDMI